MCTSEFPISYRNLERILADRSVAVDHTTLCRWVQHFAPELEKRMRRHLRPCRGPWHVDETYIWISGQQRYLYRAVDGTGQTIDFLLSAKRDKKAAKRLTVANGSKVERARGSMRVTVITLSVNGSFSSFRNSPYQAWCRV